MELLNKIKQHFNIKNNSIYLVLITGILVLVKIILGFDWLWLIILSPILIPIAFLLAMSICIDAYLFVIIWRIVKEHYEEYKKVISPIMAVRIALNRFINDDL